MAVAKPEKGRLTGEAWEEAALEALAEQGVDGLTIESLARRLGVTKGSFYWHFNTRQALIAAALARWQERDRAMFAEHVESLTDPRERLRAIVRLTTREPRVHFILSALILTPGHALVEPVLATVYQRRTAVLESTFRDLGMSPEAAAHRARLAYTAYLGFLTLTRQQPETRLRDAQLDDYLEHLIRTFID